MVNYVYGVLNGKNCLKLLKHVPGSCNFTYDNQKHTFLTVKNDDQIIYSCMQNLIGKTHKSYINPQNHPY